jgi:hypothetical protein
MQSLQARRPTLYEQDINKMALQLKPRDIQIIRDGGQVFTHEIVNFVLRYNLNNAI